MKTRQGFDVYMLDWGEWWEDRHLSFGDLVDDYITGPSLKLRKYQELRILAVTVWEALLLLYAAST